ncbi:cyclic nucleotide-binding domain-containing protein [Magnetospirillum sp. UT-4]|uniref:cyclic nucleotide-binding domain-containing protein n=1 Tax=Magnetospirillum sp. UT-4 TaxID=2681467 RepID=UPI00157486AF|nr:cyclic nucleotide-binding domain-containing protein [Magnetospirillum sp. UT-4]
MADQLGITFDDYMAAGSTRLERLTFAAGEQIFAQGDLGDAAYIVHKGSVRLFQHVDGQRVEVAEVGTGGIFGEMAVLDGGRRSASAVAVDEALLSRVPVPVFRRKLAGTDRFLRALIELFIRNIRNSPRLFLRRPRSFRDHVTQSRVFAWNMRRFAGRMEDQAMATEVVALLDRLDTVLGDLDRAAERCPDKRHNLIGDEELRGVQFSDVIGTEGQRILV